MQYELYEQIICKEHNIILFAFESNNLLSIYSYIENFPLDYNSKYIIVNNLPTHPIDYSQLGFESLPTEEELYDVIFDCKLANNVISKLKKVILMSVA